MALGLQANDRKVRTGADVAFAVILIYVQRCAVQVFCNAIQVTWIQKDILPIDAAFAASSAVKSESVIEADGTGLKVFCDIIHTHYIYSYALGVPRNVDTPVFL